MGRKSIAQQFENLEAAGDKAFIAYIMAGDGGLLNLKDQILQLESAGVSIVELGIPFSDPVADGPAIQEAGKRALAEGVTLKEVLTAVAGFKDEINIPIVIMTYANPVLRLGVGNFAVLCKEASISGVIIPDVPYEESAEFEVPLKDVDIALIRFVTLTSSKARMEEVLKTAEGFVYAVTVNGTTGVRDGFDDSLGAHLEAVRQVSPVPVCAGFGIKTREQAREIGAHCDGVIVGSRIVELLHAGQAEKIADLIPESAGIEKVRQID
ncbi:tryptophan synthase subunit alpha [Salinicoccus sp. CNSTN-B1]